VVATLIKISRAINFRRRPATALQAVSVGLRSNDNGRQQPPALRSCGRLLARCHRRPPSGRHGGCPAGGGRAMTAEQSVSGIGTARAGAHIGQSNDAEQGSGPGFRWALGRMIGSLHQDAHAAAG
jgi:hypothetical protein